MDKSELYKFKYKLLEMKQKILNGGLMSITDDLTISTDDLPDETDLAANVINQQVSFNIRNRELVKLRLIESALQRIEDGSYGTCEDCDEFIGQQRLNHQPWTNLCIIHAEEKERENSKFARRA